MEISDLILTGIVIIVFVIIILVLVYWFLSIKNKGTEKSSTTKDSEDTSDKKGSNEKSSAYTKLSIMNFMEFDKIEDNMIVQNGNKRYLMVIECEGINYDLMSEVEKTSVEAGFIQFLNTLRHPIQIYTQTRTINIGNSIEKYKNKIKEVKTDLEQKQNQLNKIIQSESSTSSRVQQLRLEVARNQNLYEYGKDVVSNIEKMSLNKNVLRKHYYIIVPYYTGELEVANMEDEEKRNMIFSELYTRCQAITRTLFACSMKSKVLNSNELIELLYVAYNRDESEVLSVEKAIKSGYTELYSTAPEVLDKRIEALNKEIEKRALELAYDSVDNVKSEKQLKMERIEKDKEKLIKELAESIIRENKKFIGKDIVEKAIENVHKDTEEGGNKRDEQKKERTRTRAK